jgi:succinyl-diaminopimelate desuccinylase
MEKLLNLLSILISINSEIINNRKDYHHLSNYLTQDNINTEIFCDKHSIYNLYGEYIGDQNRKDEIDLLFLGHLDVVPPGDLQSWKFNPFEMTIHENIIYGRGAVDMKSSIASFTEALINNISLKEDFKKNIAIAITGDEETTSYGAKALLKYLKDKNKNIKQILIGEPTSDKIFGDSIKNGRRGSANFDLVIYGTQGHVAYPKKANNPINYGVKIADHLISSQLDDGNNFFSPSNLEITSIDTNNPTRNLIPSSISMKFNIRYNNLQTLNSLTQFCDQTIQNITQNSYKLKNISNSESFFCEPNSFSENLIRIIEKHCNCQSKYSTSGGTSDGRFLYQIAPIIEFGPLNESAHKINEHISLKDLKKLYQIYYEIIQSL